jgi:putative FmdB family regulatory protein
VSFAESGERTKRADKTDRKFMPTYEYVCEACGHEFERFQKMSDDPVRKCQECGRLKVRRRISSGGGVLFKGPGFYATDYRKPSPGAEKTSKPKTEPKPKPDSGESGSKTGEKSGD